MPTLNSHTHCQSRTSQRTNQSLAKSVSVPTYTQNDRQTSGGKKKHDCLTSPIRKQGFRAS